MKMFSKGKADLLSLAIRRLGDPMRSDLIFAALKNVPNRYLLVKAVSTATRGFHRPGLSIQGTVNDVLVRFSHANPVANVELVQGAVVVSMLRRGPHPSWSADAVLELERILGYQKVGPSIANLQAR